MVASNVLDSVGRVSDEVDVDGTVAEGGPFDHRSPGERLGNVDVVEVGRGVVSDGDSDLGRVGVVDAVQGEDGVLDVVVQVVALVLGDETSEVGRRVLGRLERFRDPSVLGRAVELASSNESSALVVGSADHDGVLVLVDELLDELDGLVPLEDLVEVTDKVVGVTSVCEEKERSEMESEQARTRNETNGRFGIPHGRGRIPGRCPGKRP